MDGLLLFFVGWIVLVILAILFILNLPIKSPQEQAPKLPGFDFVPTQMFRASDGMGGLAVNEQTCHICLINHGSIPPQLLPVTKLIGVFLVKNGEIIGQGLRSRPKHIQSFVRVIHTQVQSLVASWGIPGPGNSNQRIDLIVALHDELEPLHTVNFLNMETKEGGILYEKALGTAKHWHNLLDSLILKADHLDNLQGIGQDAEHPASPDSMSKALKSPTESVDKQVTIKQESEARKEKILAGKS